MTLVNCLTCTGNNNIYQQLIDNPELFSVNPSPTDLQRVHSMDWPIPQYVGKLPKGYQIIEYRLELLTAEKLVLETYYTDIGKLLAELETTNYKLCSTSVIVKLQQSFYRASFDQLF